MIIFPLVRRFLSAMKVFYMSFAMAVGGYAVLLLLMAMNVTSIAALFFPAFFIFVAFGMLTVLPIAGLLAAVFYFHRKYILTEEKVTKLADELKRM